AADSETSTRSLHDALPISPRGWRLAHEALEGAREGRLGLVADLLGHGRHLGMPLAQESGAELHAPVRQVLHRRLSGQLDEALVQDRKSTRLNSSHVKISYA